MACRCDRQGGLTPDLGRDADWFPRQLLKKLKYIYILLQDNDIL